MKKKTILAFTLAIFLLLGFCQIPCLADTPTVNEQIITQTIVLDDHSYIIDTLIISEPQMISTYATYSTKSAVRTYTYYNSNNKKCWSFSVTGNFKYNGTKSFATSASSKSEIFISGWKCSSKSASYSGAVAKGSATFKRLLSTKKISIGIKCSPTGKLSNVNY